MSEEITLQYESLQQKINALKKSISQIDDNIPTSNTFQTTNIEPFIYDLENFRKSLELLQAYKKVLHHDMDMLEKATATIQQKDAQLSRSYEITWEYRPK